MKTSLLWCLVAFVVLCEFGFEVAGRSKGPKRRDRGGRRGRVSHQHMCMGVMRRSMIDSDDINCTSYDEVVNSDIADLYSGKQEDVFQSWIDMLNAMTSREMEADDDDDVRDDENADDDNTEDELMMMCKRKFCFKKKMREHIHNGNEIPEFCNVEGRTSEDWTELRASERAKPGEPRQPMTVEKYTTIFCSKLHHPDYNRGKGGPGGRRGRGRGGRGRGGRRGPGGRRREKPSNAQEVPTQP